MNWDDYLLLPERSEDGQRYELHDGEVVLVPPARPLHIKLQKRLERLLEALAGDQGVVAVEFPYRPLPNLQYWVADVAYIPCESWDAMPPDEYLVYAPGLVVEVLSPSNTAVKVNRQRIMALSAGTQEFWVVEAGRQMIEVTSTGGGTQMYSMGMRVPVRVFGGAGIRVDKVFGA